MDTNQENELRETAWRRPLTPAESEALEKILAAKPDARSTWREEAALNRLLASLPPAPLSSNFTARVLQGVAARPARPSWIRWLSPAEWFPATPLPRVAMGAVMLAVGLGSFNQAGQIHRAQMARRADSASQLAVRVEWLQDYDTIKQISQVKVADDELLAVLE